MNSLSEIGRKLEEAKRLFIISHLFPDGDSVGSTLALGLALIGAGKSVDLISLHPVPVMYAFLPGASLIGGLSYGHGGYDTGVVVDCTDFDRCGQVAEFMASVPRIINIDHHVSNKGFGHYNYVDPQASATGEIIYDLLRIMDLPITSDIATCLYTAIVMDTGAFIFENTTARTHRIVADLIEKGANLALANVQLFEEKPLLAIKLLREALSTLEITPCRRIATMTIDLATMERLGASDEHADGLVNYAKGIRGIEVGMLFRELGKGMVKVSLRSKGAVDVNRVAARFGGGGHPRAAGCVLAGKLEEVKAKFLAAARQEFLD